MALDLSLALDVKVKDSTTNGEAVAYPVNELILIFEPGSFLLIGHTSSTWSVHLRVSSCTTTSRIDAAGMYHSRREFAAGSFITDTNYLPLTKMIEAVLRKSLEGKFSHETPT